MARNLPPGVDGSEDYFNPPDMSHDHRWSPLQGPTFEDGAAIFVRECEWKNVQNAERGYKGETVVTESIPCEKTQRYRFEPSYIWYPSGKGAPIKTINGLDQLPVDMEHGLIQTEKAAQRGDEDVSIEVDPDPESGSVRVEWNGWTVIYKA